MANFLSNIFSSLFGGNDPEAQRKRVLKGIAKNLSKTKHSFFKFSSHEAEPALAKFFYDIYKAISNAQVIFQEEGINLTSCCSLKN